MIKRQIPNFTKISKYPSVSRDISFLVDKSVLAGDIIKAIRALNINILKDVSIFDIYESQDSDRKSIALNMLFQDNLQTLDDKVIVESIDKVLEALKTKFNIEQRV